MFAAPRRFMCQVPEEEVIVPGEIIDESKPKEYSPKVQKIVDEIAELNLMEVTDLVDLLTVRRSRSFAHSLTTHTHIPTGQIRYSRCSIWSSISILWYS